MDNDGRIWKHPRVAGVVGGCAGRECKAQGQTHLPAIAGNRREGGGWLWRKTPECYTELWRLSFMACCNVLSIVVQQETVVFKFPGVH